MQVKQFKPLGNKVKTRKPRLTKSQKLDRLIKSSQPQKDSRIINK